MPEMVVPSERVRDLTAAPRRIPIEIEGSVTYEIALIIWSSFNEKNTNTAHELGEGWHENIRELTSATLAEELIALGGPWCAGWLAVSSFMLAAPHPHDPMRVFDWLEGVDDNRLRRWLIGYSTHSDDHSLIEQAAEGDLDSAVRLLGDNAKEKPELVEHLRWMLETEGLAARFAAALKQFHAEVFSELEEEFSGAIRRAAAARRAAPARGDAKEVVEEITSGIDFEIPVGMSRVILIPSVVTRPLSLIDAHRGTLVVYYGIADEFINSDPEAPPSWLVRTYKALSDERRLRIMRRLSEGPATLDDLTDMLGLSKSTVHHHIALLRGAGLVRVHIPDEKITTKKSYSLREQALADARGFLDSYLTTAEEQQDVL